MTFTLETPSVASANAPAPGSARDDAVVARPERVLSTLNKDGSRRWLKPRLSPGRFLTARRLTAYALVGIFTLLPYIQISGKPAILLDLASRHFTIFGATFLPTDSVLLALLLVGTFVTVFLLTALLGRVWCGWACPQTVYMEFLFRPIERLFDGAPGRRISAGFRGSGAALVLKYVAYLVVSAYLAHTFLAYFVGVDQLAQWVRRSPFEHPAGFLIVASVTALMMFDFCYFREQTCIVACPYGRFQSVMLDRDSLIISYDVKRGEPRGKLRRAARHPATTSTNGAAGDGPTVSLPVLERGVESNNSSQGDCIDCNMCVVTCPTGIDIREGLQMECIGCAQCIDACDAVMDKIGRPRGLIRYSSQSAMDGERRHLIRPRVIIYPLVLVIVASLFGMALASRGDANVTILRGLGRTFSTMPSGEIANTLRIKIVNRTNEQRRYVVAVEDIANARVQIEEEPITLQGGESHTVAATVLAPFEAFVQGKCMATIVVSDGQGYSRRMPWQLMGPGSRPAAHPAPMSAPAGREDVHGR